MVFVHIQSWKACRVVLDAARERRSPVALRITYGATVDLRSRKAETAVAEAVTIALSIRALARQYQVPVILGFRIF